MFSISKLARAFIYAAITYGTGYYTVIHGPIELTTIALFWAGMLYFACIQHDDKIVRSWVWVKGRLWVQWHRWNSLPCPYCGASDFSERKEVIEWGWGTMEYEEYCLKCGGTTNYWAYGYFEYPKTRTEYIKWWWNMKVLSRFRRLRKISKLPVTRK